MVTLGAQIISDKPDKLKEMILWYRSLGIFDEVVAIGDTDKFPAEIEESAKLADKYKLLSIKHQEEAINIATGLGTTDWMLRIDDDERIGFGIKDSIREIITNDLVATYWFPRMWLYKDEEHYLSESPWFPDWQPRLFRKGKYTCDVDGIHIYPTIVGESSCINHPIFHYILLDYTFEQRMEKCKVYAKIMNFTLDEFLGAFGLFYVPEKYNTEFTTAEYSDKVCK